MFHPRNGIVLQNLTHMVSTGKLETTKQKGPQNMVQPKATPSTLACDWQPWWPRWMATWDPVAKHVIFCVFIILFKVVCWRLFFMNCCFPPIINNHSFRDDLSFLSWRKSSFSKPWLKMSMKQTKVARSKHAPKIVIHLTWVLRLCFMFQYKPIIFGDDVFSPGVLSKYKWWCL